MYDREVYHFLFLHFPIAIFITGYLFHLLFCYTMREQYKIFFLWMVGMGIIWSLFSIITGYITAFEIEHMANFKDIFSKNHSNVMLITTLIFSCIYYFRNISNKVLLFIHTIAVFLLIYGSHLGAKWADRI